MKKILVTRRLLRSNEDRIKELYDANLNLNDELYSQDKLIELSQGCDGVLSALTCLLYTSPSPRDVEESRMPSSA